MDSRKKDEEISEVNSLDGILLRVDAIEEAVEVNSANSEDFMRRISALLEEHISKMEQRYTSSFGVVSADIATANNNTVRVETDLTTRIVELERNLSDKGTQGDFVPSLPLIQEMVNEAAAVLQVNVEAINRSTTSELKSLEEKVHSLQDRFEETERAQTVPPLGPGRLYDRVNILEDMLHSMQNQQRLDSNLVYDTSHLVQTMEIDMESQFRAVGGEIQHLQGMVAQRAEEMPIEPEERDPVYEHHDNPSFRSLPSMATNERLEYTLLRGEVIDAPSPSEPKGRRKKKQQRKSSSIPSSIPKKKQKKKENPGAPGGDSSSSSSSESSSSEPNDDGSNDQGNSSSDEDDHPGTKRGSLRFIPLGGSNKNRRESIIGDEASISPRSFDDHGGRRHSNRSIIYVQPSPTVNDLKLKEIKIGSVLYFCKSFNNEASKFRGGLNAANYIDEKLLCQMKQVAYKERMAGADGILVNGSQRINNEEIFAILAIMCAPTNTQRMQLELSKSCWPKRGEYKTTEDIAKNIAEFRVDLLTYVDRFEDKLILFRRHRRSRKLLPENLFKKGGGDPGLADYFLGGLPDKNLGLRVWSSVDHRKREKCKTFDKFKKYFILAIEAMEEREKDRDINRQICFGVREMIKTDQSKVTIRPKNNDRRSVQRDHNPQRVNQLDEPATVVSDSYSDEEIEVVFTKDDEYKDELPSAIEDEYENEEGSILTEEDVSELANLLQPSDTKTQGICYDMLYKGKCEKVNCPYSHKAEDIEKAKKLKALRLATGKNSGNKSVSFNRTTYPNTRKT